MINKYFWLILLGVFAGFLGTSASAQQFDRIYIFGDSLSDQGYQNLNPTDLQENKSAIWSTPGGQEWGYYLAQRLNVPNPGANNELPLVTTDAPDAYVSGTLDGTNYAAGGSTTGGAGFGSNPNYQPPSLLQQICHYTNYTTDNCIGQQPIMHADPNALYVIWSGSNDMFAAIGSNTMNGETINSSTQNVIMAIQQLQSSSPVPLHILVVDVPDLGKTPISKVLALKGIDPTTLSNYVHTFDAIEQIRVQQLNNQTFGIFNRPYRVVFVDTFQLIDDLTSQTSVSSAMPEIFQGYRFVNNKDSACPIISQDKTQTLALTCEPTLFNLKEKNNYVFEDGVHPTDETHQLIAKVFYDNIMAAYISGFWH